MYWNYISEMSAILDFMMAAILCYMLLAACVSDVEIELV